MLSHTIVIELYLPRASTVCCIDSVETRYLLFMHPNSDEHCVVGAAIDEVFRKFITSRAVIIAMWDSCVLTLSGYTTSAGVE